jgi:hypothetical protein
MAQARLRAQGKGGLVDQSLSSGSGEDGFATANEGGDGDFRMASPRSLAEERLKARVQRRMQREEEMRRQEEARIQNEQLLKQQLEQLEREEQAKRARTQQMAASSLARVTGHPTASSSASAAPSFTVTPEMLDYLRRVQQGSTLVPRSILVPRAPDIQIQYLQPQGQTAITPARTADDTFMTSTTPQQKRGRSTSPPRAEPKAKTEPAPAAVAAPKAKAIADPSPAAAATGKSTKVSPSEGVKTKTLKYDKPSVQKETDDKYSTWNSWTKAKIYEQLINHHGYKPIADSTYKNKTKDDLLALAEKMVPLTRTGMDAKSQGKGKVQPSLPVPGAGKTPAGRQ